MRGKAVLRTASKACRRGNVETLIGKRRRTPNFDPPPDARIVQVRDVNLADVWPTITRVGPRAGRAIYAIEWRVTLAGQATLRRVRGTAGARAEGTVACGLHRQNEIHADVDSIVSKSLAKNRVALPGDTRAAPPGGVWVAPCGRVRVAPLKLDRPIVRVLPVHNDGRVSRYQA